MIRTTLEFIKEKLTDYMISKDAAYTLSDSVHVSGLVNPDGSAAIDTTKHITMLLVNIDEERMEGQRAHYLPVNGSLDKVRQVNPPATMNLYLLFAASIQNYATALQDLSLLVHFFQKNPVFDDAAELNMAIVDPVNHPWKLLEKLIFQPQNLTFEQQNNLWATLGSKYLPSIVYKVRMLTIWDTNTEKTKDVVREIALQNA